MNSRKRMHGESGMTLLELMFACGVVAMAMSFLFGSLLSLNVVGDLSQSRGLAVNHLSSVMEDLRHLSLEQLTEYAPPTLFGVGVLERVEAQLHASDGTVIPLPVPSEMFASAADPASMLDAALPNPCRMDVTLTWMDERGHAFSVSASEMRYR